MAAEATITQLLERWSGGDRAALDDVTRLVYDHLHQIAARHMVRENAHHTLTPTAVVHEAYMRLADYGMALNNRGHFLAIAAREMRRVLVDHARKRNSQKRGGEGWQRVTLHEDRAAGEDGTAEILAIEEALEKLAAVDPRKAKLVDLIVFAGMTTEEAAQELEVSLSTVNRDWRMAKAFLQSELRAERE